MQQMCALFAPNCLYLKTVQMTEKSRWTAGVCCVPPTSLRKRGVQGLLEQLNDRLRVEAPEVVPLVNSSAPPELDLAVSILQEWRGNHLTRPGRKVTAW